jgi:alkylation response protein AidB-like acyl-CoA dehydrogenase
MSDASGDEKPLADAVRAVLDTCVPCRDGSERDSTLGAGGYDLEAGRRYMAATVAEGFGVPTWPAEYGGRDANPAETALIAAVHREYAMPDLYPFGVGMKMVGPTLLERGTPDQHARWLRRIASGADIWCQMFSEPDAGSDLANVATTAVRDGDMWRLNGQKVWTSRGAYAQWGMCLARTDPEVPKHEGITMFVVRMSAPGVDVRPLRQMNGDSHFSEVFLSDVEVGDADRIGDVHTGWQVAVALLAHERSGGDRSAPKTGALSLPTWLADLVASGAMENPVLRDRAIRLYSLDETIRFTHLRSVANRRAGRKPGPEGSGTKLQTARSFKARVDLAAAATGAEAMLSTWAGHVDLLTAPSMSIRGGTDEIQLNILGERVLGLPAEPRADRGVPWTLSRRGVTAKPKQ